ncbi:uncharacterized protein LOC129815465 [Salvelinus fontinalis]|uniref:uncharacterized protein LOC129815465 n=1 Tax=Salvelinus fontinalis TaxID=8038 RepID=UPI002484E00D|nr:uncharacterized protein LOC129815465 [Salvelinus fontinalis]
MALATIGSLTPFDPKNQEWEEYCEIMEHFFAANEITDAAKQKSILISVVGAQTYSLMRNLLSPDKPGEKSFIDLVELLKNHFNPKPSEIVQRFKFDSRMRKPIESVGEYVAELRKLALDCNYGNTLSQMLRDRLVCGINDDRIQIRLLSEPNLTFENALKLAQAMESANRNALDLQARGATACHTVKESSAERVEFQRTESRGAAANRDCYRCKGKHAAFDCKFKHEKCYACGIIGHIARACRNKKKATSCRKEDGQKTEYLQTL